MLRNRNTGSSDCVTRGLDALSCYQGIVIPGWFRFRARFADTIGRGNGCLMMLE